MAQISGAVGRRVSRIPPPAHRQRALEHSNRFPKAETHTLSWGWAAGLAKPAHVPSDAGGDGDQHGTRTHPLRLVPSQLWPRCLNIAEEMATFSMGRCRSCPALQGTRSLGEAEAADDEGLACSLQPRYQNLLLVILVLPLRAHLQGFHRGSPAQKASALLVWQLEQELL